jgi:hypothetical protein
MALNLQSDLLKADFPYGISIADFLGALLLRIVRLISISTKEVMPGVNPFEWTMI